MKKLTAALLHATQQPQQPQQASVDTADGGVANTDTGGLGAAAPPPTAGSTADEDVLDESLDEYADGVEQVSLMSSPFHFLPVY